jgi:cytochrome b
LVALLLTALVTGFLLPQWWMGLHIAAGTGIVGLLAFRLIWAFYGPEYSRLASFVPRRRALWAYIRGLLFLRPPHHFGHNPLGSLMVLGLFAVVFALMVTGFLVLGGEEKLGPLRNVLSYPVGNRMKSLHSLLSWIVLGMAVLHVAGVVATSRLFGERLVRSMIHGTKRIPAGVPVPRPRPAQPFRALTAFMLLAAAFAGGWWWLNSLPDRGWRPVVLIPAYQSACGACHSAHHPSLLPAASWARIMTSLDEHFGEDASLPEGQRLEIAAFLGANASETFDTEAAVRFRSQTPSEPLRITATDYWRRKHASVAPEVFARPRLGGKANCGACHEDADTGRFDDSRIHIPGGSS